MRKKITPTLRFQVLICYNNYNYRLNYILTEHLYDLYCNWRLKNNYSTKKFSYFYNEIKNG